MKRVRVDFSATVRDGLIKANMNRASETLRDGDDVEAYDPAEDMEFSGVVDHLSQDGRFAFLRMNWQDDSVRNWPGMNWVLTAWSEAPVVAVPACGMFSAAHDVAFVQPTIRVATPHRVVNPADRLMRA